MSELVQRPFEEVLEEAIITNCLEQFEEAAMERGREEVREEARKEAREEVIEEVRKEAREEVIEEVRKRERGLISKLLENHSPEEVANDLDLPLEMILEIKNSK